MSLAANGLHRDHMPPRLREDVRARLKAVEGQVHALEQMIGNDSPDTQVLTQIAAARAGVHQVGRLVLRNYVSRCVTGALSRGEEDVIDELMAVLAHFSR